MCEKKYRVGEHACMHDACISHGEKQRDCEININIETTNSNTHATHTCASFSLDGLYSSFRSQAFRRTSAAPLPKKRSMRACTFRVWEHARNVTHPFAGACWLQTLRRLAGKKNLFLGTQGRARAGILSSDTVLLQLLQLLQRVVAAVAARARADILSSRAAEILKQQRQEVGSRYCLGKGMVTDKPTARKKAGKDGAGEKQCSGGPRGRIAWEQEGERKRKSICGACAPRSGRERGWMDA